MSRENSSAEPGKAAVPGAATMRVLLAAAEAATGVHPLRGHYQSYYRHWAARSPFHAEQYRAFAVAVRDTALRVAGQDFTAMSVPDRRRLLDEFRATPDGRAYEDVFFQETLAVFLRTDAWLQLGYPSWEGSPRAQHHHRRRK